MSLPHRAKSSLFLDACVVVVFSVLLADTKLSVIHKIYDEQT